MFNLAKNFLGSIVGKYTGKSAFLRPAILHLTVTNRCNLRCRMCNVWKEKPKSDISEEVIGSLIDSSHLSDFQIIEYGGGEPFLGDLVGITKKFLEAGAPFKMILVTTNGWQTDRIRDQVEGLLAAGRHSIILNVSVDGLQETHDRLRGREGSWDRAMNTVTALKEIASEQPKLKVGMKFTIMRDNYREIWPVYLKARKMDVEFTAKPAAVFGSLHNEDMDFDFSEEEVDEIISTLKRIEDDRGDRALASSNLFGRLYYFSNRIFNQLQLRYLRENVAGGARRQVIPCFSSFFSAMVHVNGEVCCCPTLMKEVGRLPGERFDDVWRGDKMEAIRKYIHAGRCSCFSQCDQMPSLVVRYKLRLMKEIFTSYLRR